MPQRAVQSCHAAIEAAKIFHSEEHPHLILCEVENKTVLWRTAEYLIDNGINHVRFEEEDLDNELTAIATEILYGDQRKLMKDFKLLKV